MPEEDPVPISEPIEEALLRLVQPSLLEQYQAEKDRHREELRSIEVARKRARAWLKRLFGPVLQRREAELEAEYLERTQGEADRHAHFLAELRETIRDYARKEAPGSSMSDEPE